MKRVEAIGPKDAKIMIIGEAPGTEEEKHGQPFVGTAGRLLDNCLSRAGLRRNEIYITNVVKVRPPGNKIERLYEIGIKTEDYIKELQEEINEVNPNVIIPLGNLALRIVMGNSFNSITKYRGSIFKLSEGEGGIKADRDYKIIPSIHPALALRQYDFVHLLSFDLQRIRKESEFPEVQRKERNYKFGMTNFQDYITELDMMQEEGEYISLDLETFRSAKVIRCIGLGHREDYALCIPLLNKMTPVWSETEENEIWRRVVKLLATKKVIAQNANFELTQMEEFTQSSMNIWMDTMRAHALLYPEFPHGLDFLGSVYTDIPYWKEDGKTTKDDSDDSKLWEYNCNDVAATFEIAMELWEELKETKMEEFYFSYDHQLMYSLWRMEMRGVKIDLDLLKEVSIEINNREEELSKEVDEITGGVNINSPKQLTEYLYNKLKLPKQYDRKSGRLSSGKDIIEKLAVKHHKPELKKILELRNIRKLKSTYVDIKMDKDFRMRTSYGLTVSGRLSSRKNIFGSGMNLQNIPPSSRKIFVPDEGKVLDAADLKQAEAMAVAWESGDEGLKNVFNEGGDIHSSIARLIFNTVTPTKEQRSLAKRVVHGTNYCMGINTLAMFCEIPVSQAKIVQGEYFKLFPMVKAWHHKIEGELNSTRQLMTPMGRKRTFFGRWGDPIKREAISYIPQSTVADYINAAFVRLDHALPKGAELLIQVHDEVVVQRYPEQEKEVHDTLRRVVERPVIVGGDYLTIPLDIETGSNWSECKG